MGGIDIGVLAGGNNQQKYAITLTHQHAPTMAAGEPTNASDAGKRCHTSYASLKEPVPTMPSRANNISACMPFWECHLSSHPDSDFVKTVLNYLKNGIPVGFKGPNDSILSNNWPSSTKYARHVKEFIQDNISKGRVAGPLPHPLPSGYRASPQGAFEKSDGKVRVIHNLSWPPGRSVNDFIPSQECALTYVTVDNAANLCAQYEQPWLVKIDLKSAFLSCPVHVKDHHLLGFSLGRTLMERSTTITLKFFVSDLRCRPEPLRNVLQPYIT